MSDTAAIALAARKAAHKAKPAIIEGDEILAAELVPNLEISRRFITELTGEENPVVRVRGLYERHKDSNPEEWKAEKKNHTAKEWFGTLTALWSKIKAAQMAGYAAYLVVNQGTCAGEFIHDKDITAIRAFFIDVDGTPWPEAFHQEPDFFVRRDETHAHAYWVEPTEDVSQFTPLQLRLAKYYGSDPAVCNPSRIMRLPGSLHLKGKNPILVSFEENPNRLRDALGAYGIAGLADGLPELPKSEPIKPYIANGKPVSPAIVEAMLRCIPPSIKRNDGWLAVCGALTGAPIDDPTWDGLDLFIRWSRGDFHPGLAGINFDEQECVDTWQWDLAKRACGQTVPDFGALVTLAREHGYIGRSDSVPASEMFKEYIADPDPVSLLSATSEDAEEVRLAEKFRVIRSGDFHKLKPPAYVVARLIPEKAIGLLYGPWGSFKTFVLIEILGGIAGNVKILGKYAVNLAGPTLLAASEQPNAAAKKRFPAWCKKNGLLVPNVPFHLTRNVPLVQNPAEVIAFVKAIQREKIHPLVVGIDTLTRAMGGLDLNAPQAAGVMTNAADYIRDSLGCAVIMTGHMGKDKSKKSFGSNLIPANCDFVFEIDRPLPKGPAIIFKNEKLKDDDTNPDQFLKSEQFAGSIVLNSISESEYKRLIASGGPGEDQALTGEIMTCLRANGFVGANTCGTKELLNLVLAERGELENDARVDDKARERLRNKIRALQEKHDETILALGRKAPGKTAGRQWSAPAMGSEDEPAGHLGSLEDA